LKDDIGHLGDLAENLNAQDERLEQTIKNLPPKLKKVIRAGSYGSWFNFYLCGASGKVGLEPYIKPFEIPVFTSGQERCGADPDGGDSGNTDSLAGLPLPDLPLPGGDTGVPKLPVPDLPLLSDLSLGGN